MIPVYIAEHFYRSVIECESADIGLAVNGGKTKYILPTSKDMLLIRSPITADNYTFEVVNDFIFP